MQNFGFLVQAWPPLVCALSHDLGLAHTCPLSLSDLDDDLFYGTLSSNSYWSRLQSALHVLYVLAGVVKDMTTIRDRSLIVVAVMSDLSLPVT